jgi:hypothetical protein
MNNTDLIALGIVGIFSALIYFAPTIIAFNREHGNKYVVLIINIVFGWTLIGWLVAIFIASSKNFKT